jgi:glycosyltransferase involved in cell wall biosynthesis
MVLFEAMACGKPVIASSLPGLCDIVRDGQTGLLVAPRDIAQLATAMQKLAADMAARCRMGEKARMTVQTYAWDQCAYDMAGIMREVAG